MPKRLGIVLAMTESDLHGPLGALRPVPPTGVGYVVAEAQKLGYENGHPNWSNLGQGQPEIGLLAGAPPRVDSIALEPADHAYGPAEGLRELRERIAAHYNRLFRTGKRSQYTAQNVAIAPGGRAALARALAALGNTVLGHQVPDYPNYAELLAPHLGRLTTVPVRTAAADGFRLRPGALRQQIVDQGVGALLLSNPCNPTGNVLRGDDLFQVVAAARELRVTLLLDEFYSHYVYEAAAGGRATPSHGPVSGGEFVDDVDRDPVLLFDGLTKNFRYPGWRLGWVVGPTAMVQALTQVGAVVDGGASRWAQRAALLVLDPGRADQESAAVRQAFCQKRNLLVERLQALGVVVPGPTLGGFYAFGDVSRLPPPFDSALSFFRAGLERRVLTVPGPLFDGNPGCRQQDRGAYRSMVRFSYGPSLANLQQGLDRLEAMVRGA